MDDPSGTDTTQESTRRRWLPDPVDLDQYDPGKLLVAQSETGKTIGRLMLTLLGFGFFCVLALASPDSALLGETATLNVPFAGPVPFQTFLIIGPMILAGLRFYLQIYVDHWYRIEDRIPETSEKDRAPTVSPLRHPMLRFFSGFVLFLLVPVVAATFAHKASALPSWDVGMFLFAVCVIAIHAHLFVRHVAKSSRLMTWGIYGLVLIAIVATTFNIVATTFGFQPPWDFRRSLDLDRANLSGWYLARRNLEGATLVDANLEGAILREASLMAADLANANLQGADLNTANLIGARVRNANLQGAILSRAGLVDADLRTANLQGANIIFANLKNAKLEVAYLQEAFLDEALLIGANLRGADLRSAEGITCLQLKQAKNWFLAYRDEDLACGRSIPTPP